MVARPPRLAGELYTRAHAAFRARSDQQRWMLEWLVEEVKRLPSLPESLLSVGCGAGLFDLSFARRLHSEGGHLETVGVDPNPAQVAEFVARFAAAGLPAQGVQRPFSEAALDRLFHLVLFSHSLYYLPDPLDALRRGRGLLAPHGRVVVFHGTEQGIKQARGALLDAVGAPRRPFFGADQLSAALSGEGTPFAERTLASRVDVTPCFTPSDGEGAALWSFLLQTDWAALELDLQAHLRGALREICVQEEEARWWLRHPVVAFSIAG